MQDAGEATDPTRPTAAILTSDFARCQPGWLTPPLRSLVGSALLDGKSATIAWRDWRAVNEIDALEGETADLAALLYLNLKDAGLNSSELARLRGAYRYHWTRYQNSMRNLQEVTKQLEGCGVRFALHRAAAHAFIHYDRPVGRTLRCLDLLIDCKDLSDADSALHAAGWTSAKSLPPERLKPFLPGLAYRKPNGSMVYLLWHPYEIACEHRAEADFWKRLRETKIEGTQIPAPDATDLLLLSCIHAARQRQFVTVQSFVDLCTLLRRRGKSIDWLSLRARAKEIGMLDEVCSVLCRLRNEIQAGFSALVRPEAQSELCRFVGSYETNVSAFDVSTERDGFAGRLGDHRSVYNRVCQVQDLRASRLGFLAYLLQSHRWYWQLPSAWMVPFVGLLHVCRGRFSDPSGLKAGPATSGGKQSNLMRRSTSF